MMKNVKSDMNETTTGHYTRALKTLAAILLLGILPQAQAQALDLILDNSDARFSTHGTWPVSTAVAGYEGSNYQTHIANGPAPGAIVVDNSDAGFSVTGTWSASTAVTGYLGGNYQVHSANGEEPGAIVLDNAQGQASGTWGNSTSVIGYYGSNYQTHAAGSGSNSFNWNTPVSGTYQVYARWTAHPNRASNAQYTVTDSSGPHTVSVNQQANGGTWQLLGSYTFDTVAAITLTDQANGYVIADAIKLVPPNAAPNTATWTPVIPAAGSYTVYARWTAHPNRATNASYTVTDSTGSHTVTVDQQQNGGTWQTLGNYALDANSKISLTDQANGYVIADAIQIVPADQPQNNTATWTPNVSGSHQLYAKWTQHPNRASNAGYTITDSSGSHTVSVNQQQNGATWNLLGIFDLTTTSTISLTDQANGYVIADAIKLVATNVAPTVSLTSPANNATANAPASLNLAADATDADGTIAKVDFYANDGTTNSLIGTATQAPYTVTWSNIQIGSYSITAQATDNLNAVATSSAVNVSVVNGEAQVYYIHADHLDTPRMITDTAGNVVWEWQNTDPYGSNVPNENPSGLGVFKFDLRYAGMTNDSEINTFYNFYRDCYDPATGRYCQSDPIGLAGGSFSTYTYVDSNPLSYVDPLGLAGSTRSSAPPPRNSGYGTQLSYDLALAQIRAIRPEYRPPASIGNRDSGPSQAEVEILRTELANLRSQRQNQCTADDLSRAASVTERNGFTSSGRSLQKHGSRPNSKWAQTDIDVNKPAQANTRAQDLVDDLLTTPGSRVVQNPRGGTDVITPDGRVIRYNRDGSFQGFRE